MDDLRYACRILMKAPGMTALAVVTLAIGIGASSAIFSLINAALIRPLAGLGAADRVVTIGRTIGGRGFDNSSYPDYVDLRDQNTSFRDVAAVQPTALSLGTGTRADRLMGAVVTANYFRTLGVQFARGAAFQGAPEDREDGPATAVISYAVWTQLFGRRDDIAGKAVTINGHPFQIAGVTAPAFRGTDPTTTQDVWLPMAAVRHVPGFVRNMNWFQQRGAVWLMLYARLKPGVTPDEAKVDVEAIATRLRTYPENEKNGWTVVRGVGLDPEDRRQMVRLAGLLSAAASVIFLLACANVAMLSLSRVAVRGSEMAVRLALGAPRARIVRQLLTESVALGLLGGAAGLLAAFWAAEGLSRLFDGSARFTLAIDLQPDVRVLAFALTASCLAGVMVALAPAFQFSRAALLPALKDTAGAARRPSGLRRGLVIAQLALSTVLLVGAGLILQSIRAFNAIQPGFDASDLVLLTVDPAMTGRYDLARLQQFHERLLDRVKRLPGVDDATLARMAPVTPRGYGVTARILDKPGSTAETDGLQFNTVAPNYFEAMRIPIVHGRSLKATDTAAAPLVTVVNEVAAQRFWPGEDAVGKLIWVKGDAVPRQVVGVAGVVKYRNLVEHAYPLAYYPVSQPHPMPGAPVVLHVRTRRAPAALATEVEHEVHAIDRDVPVFDVRSLARHMADSYWQQRLVGIVIAALSALALTLAAAGTHGVMAYAAAERKLEMGIRVAIGATSTDIVRLFTLDALRLVAAGAASGVVLARVGARLVASLLFGVTAGDPATYLSAVGFLTVVGLMAGAAPALRATRVDLMKAVRNE